MRRRLARLALSLYPLGFRRRYGQEMRALLDQAPPRALTVLDLLRGAILAHLRPASAASELVEPAERLRASVSGVLACWVVFAAAGFGFYKTTEDGGFSAAGHRHPRLGDVHAAVQALAALGSGAVVLGALPLIFAALARARSQRNLRLPVSLPMLAVFAFAGLTALLIALARLHHSDRASTLGGAALIAWGLAGLACGAVCVGASRRALFLTPLRRWRLLAALICGTLVAATMAAMTLAVAVYALVLELDSPQLVAGANGPLALIGTGASLIGQLIVMASAGLLAAIATLRGWRVAGELDASAPI